jgi:YD repeat-containing protein
VAILIALGAERAAYAQQVCYSYDSLGRLTGVIDQNGQAVFYVYDSAGNILSIRRQSPTGPVTIYSFDPPGGNSGSTVEIFGVGFSSTANQNQVMIGGVPATVVSVLACTLVAEVPANATPGQIKVTTPLGQATSSSSFLVNGLLIGGSAAAVLPNGTVQFTVLSNACSNPNVVWRVNGITGGNSTVGTINSSGLYTAPASVPVPAAVSIRADSVGCPSLFAESTVTIVTQLTGFVFATASAKHGSPPVLYPPNVVIHSASAKYGSPPVEFPPGTVIHSASVANVPVISAMSPSAAARGSNFNITVTGANFTGAMDLSFLGASTPDAAISVANISIDALGTTLTASVSISATATAGTRTVRIDRPEGNSTAGNTGANVFNITP